MGSRDDRHGFELFYRAVREDLLLQTYALTGDLTASERAVRDAMVVAWHHWRKVSQLEDPGAWVRPVAWSRAQRRHTARWWHRQRDIPAEARATLDALGSLTPTQRKALLLTALTSQPLETIASEVGLSRSALERELQLASSQFSLAREVASTAIRPLVEALRSELGSPRWPRATILLRAGTTRRRSHTTLGIAAAVAATVVAGSVVTDAAGVNPDLGSKAIASIDAPRRAAPSATAAPVLPNDVLLTDAQIGTAIGGVWTTGTTSRNTEGDGLNITCQRARYADPLGVGSLVRSFTAPVEAARGAQAQDAGQATDPTDATRTAVQSVERSADEASAGETYELTRSWYGACAAPRTQLMATYDVAGVADAATMVVLRSTADSAGSLVVAVARTGSLTTTVATSIPLADRGSRRATTRAGLAATADLLGTATAGLCSTPGGGTCPTTAAVTAIAPLPLEASPAMIGELDLPPVGTVTAPWAGTAPAAVTTNDASTRCDNATFASPSFTNTSTRSFLIPEATRLPPQFGLTETIGSLPLDQAAAFVERVRERLTTCTDRDLGTTVTEVGRADSGDRSFSAWILRVEIDDDRSVDYKMGIIRSGTSVAQIGFIAADRANMDVEQFRALCERAQQRLAALPPV